MNLWAVLGIILVVAVAAMVLRQYKPEFSLVLTLGASAIIMILLFSSLSPLLERLQSLAQKAGIDLEWVKLLLKALGVCYLSQFAADCCRDAGQSSLAGKAEMAGRITILVLSIPMLEKVIEIIFTLVE